MSKPKPFLPRRIQSAHEALFQACRNDALIVIAQPSWRSGNWNLHIPTSGRSVCTLGGVAAPGSIPAQDTHSSRSREQMSAPDPLLYILSDC